MLQIIMGSDSGAREQVRVRAAEGRPHLTITALQNPLPTIYENFLASGGFFAEQRSVIVRNAAEIPDLVTFLQKHGTDIIDSELLLILDDIEFSIAQLKFFTSQKYTITTCDTATTPPSNIFALTDALATGSKRTAYRAYQSLLVSGVAAEEMTGPIWWWLKGLGQTYHGVRDAKPFVQKKLDTAVKLFGDTVPECIVRFAAAVDNARNSSPLELELEQWIIQSMIVN